MGYLVHIPPPWILGQVQTNLDEDDGVEVLRGTEYQVLSRLGLQNMVVLGEELTWSPEYGRSWRRVRVDLVTRREEDNSLFFLMEMVIRRCRGSFGRGLEEEV